LSTVKCVFCEILAGKSPAEIVWSDDQFVAFLDIHPIATGHTLIVPRTHSSSVFELPAVQYAELFLRVRTLQFVIQQTFRSPRVGVAVEGFGVDHGHVHLVPVHRAGDLDPSKAKAVSREELRVHGERLRTALSR